MWLQFRYEDRLIDSNILAKLRTQEGRRSLRGETVLIAYIDQSDDRPEFEAIPCRYASLVGVAAIGKTASLELEVGDFAYAADLDAVNRHMRDLAGARFPHRVGAAIDGAYWFEIDGMPAVDRSSEDARWEEIVAQLSPRHDFAGERFFYMVREVIELACLNPVRAESNTLNLKPNRDYELRLYHYSPREENANAEVKAVSSGAPLEFTVTPELLLDSRYDLKRLPFRTGSTVPAARGVVTLMRRTEGDDRWEWDLDLGVRVRSAALRQLVVGVVIAAALAAAPVSAAVSDSGLSHHAKVAITIVAVISSLIAGLAASFGIQNSL